MPKKGQKRLKSAKPTAKRVRSQSSIAESTIASKITQFDVQKIERRNRLITWVGISCIMAAFFVAWIFNLKHEFQASVDEDRSDKLDWTQIRAELDKTMKQVKQSIAEIKQTQQNASSTPFKESELTVEQINLLKGKLLEEIATSTASSTER